MRSLRVTMQKSSLYIIAALALVAGRTARAIEAHQAQAFVGQDLHVQGPELISHRLETGQHVLVFAAGADMTIGGNRFSSGSAVLWVARAPEYGQKDRPGFRVIAYLRDELVVEKAALSRTTDLGQTTVEDGRAMVVWFGLAGEVFVSAGSRQVADPNGLELYAKAIAALQTAGIGQAIVKSAKLPPAKPPPGKPTEKPVEEAGPKFRYPVVLAPAGEAPVEINADKAPDGTHVATVIGRFYLSQKQDEAGGLLELQADHAVIFFSPEEFKSGQPQKTPQELLARGAVTGIYLAGDVLMTRGQRSVRADELYYDFGRSRAIVVNAEMRTFNVKDGIPIYLRAKELRQVSQNKFSAEDVTLTTDEFHKPQIAFKASRIEITDTTGQDQRKGRTDKSSYLADMRDVKFQAYGWTLLHLPRVQSNLERPDIPIKSAHVGHSGRWGYMLETRWYLARLLGLQEREGTESTLAVDHYSKRGTGVGVNIDYTAADYFGKMLGYVINDRGKDRLGRHSTRKNLPPERDLRGRFRWQHRHFLPYNWQLTGEISYSSDLNFIESYYRDEFNVGKEQETLLHLKRIQENWGLSFLAKIRINDFVNKLEELPTAEFHWTGQSFFDDRLTFYSDTQLSRLRQRFASTSTPTGPEQFFTFATTRNEVDMPLRLGSTKVVPFVAGTAAYEDRLGFFADIDGGTADRADDVWFGETGVRVSPAPFWKVMPGVKSRLWNLDQLRHIVQPHLTAVSYTQSESVIEQRDAVNVGLSQRLQTKRGTGARRRTVDWMRLNTDFTWVNDSAAASSGPDLFLWNKPFIPVFNSFGGADRRGSSTWGLRRNTFSSDYSWRISDTTAVLSDLNYDMQSGVVQQYNIGFSRMRWPNLSYYIGSRYLRRLVVTDPTTGAVLQQGSTAFVFAVTYVLDPRYTVVFSQQIDFDYGDTVASEIALIRRYHRMYWGLTYRADESLDETAVVFSIWPQGIPDLGIGPRRYMKMGTPSQY